MAADTYVKAGDYTYRRDVPASLLAGDAVRIDFQLDKAMPRAIVTARIGRGGFERGAGSK